MYQSVNKEQHINHISQCRYENLISLFVDDNLNKDDHLKIHHHLMTCESCKVKSISLKNAQRYLKDSIPRKPISDSSLLEIENEVTELISLNSKSVIEKKKTGSELRAGIWQVVTSTRFLRTCFFGLLLCYFLQHLT